MTPALYRLELAPGTRRWASGSIEDGPRVLLDPTWRLDQVLAGASSWAEALEKAFAPSRVRRLPAGARTVAPIENQEVWAAGVTYQRSRDARLEESGGEDAYDRVYRAARPELFFKAAGWRVRGPDAEIGIRSDSAWNVPEPELAVVVGADLSVLGFVLGDDVSSRSIEGENVLYLPQAKVYDGSCALGPAIVPAAVASLPVQVSLTIEREGRTLFRGATLTDRMVRTFEELAGWVGRALTFPVGLVLLTGTGIVPPSSMTLAPGDVVTVAGHGLGELRNRVALVPVRTTGA